MYLGLKLNFVRGVADKFQIYPRTLIPTSLEVIFRFIEFECGLWGLRARELGLSIKAERLWLMTRACTPRYCSYDWFVLIHDYSFAIFLVLLIRWTNQWILPWFGRAVNLYCFIHPCSAGQPAPKVPMHLCSKAQSLQPARAGRLIWECIPAPGGQWHNHPPLFVGKVFAIIALLCNVEIVT